MNKEEELVKYIGGHTLPVVEAMKIIDSNSAGLIYIVDDKNHLIGCLTDGDIRRWIIKNGDLKAPVSFAMNRNPISVYEDEAEKSVRLMEKMQVYSIAIIDKEKHIKDIKFLESYLKAKGKFDKNTLSNTPVIIMAGGKGTRLYPYTKILPKPLIPIGEIPIIERIMNRFHDYGGRDFYVTVNYKKEMIKSYFAESLHPYNIHYVDESVPLGTAGGIRLIDETFDQPVIVTNCDILIEADYKKIMDYHYKSNNDMTIISSLKNTVIPYGVLKLKEKGIVVSIDEKPQLSHFINTGMYILNPEYVEWIPTGRCYHMTDLAENMIEKKKQIGMYPISENSFLDMGEFEEMKRMEERIDSLN